MCNRDFIKAILRGDKSLLKMSEIRQVNVPKYDELSTKKLYPLQLDGHPEVMCHLPDSFPKERYPDRDYFFTVLATKRYEWLTSCIEHAKKMRYSSQEESLKAETVACTAEWFDALTEKPFFGKLSIYSDSNS